MSFQYTDDCPTAAGISLGLKCLNRVVHLTDSRIWYYVEAIWTSLFILRARQGCYYYS